MNNINNNENLTEKKKQAIRFRDVMLYLSDIGITSTDILKNISERLSEYTMGKREINREFEILHSIGKSQLADYGRKSEPKKEFLEFLNEKYHINPDYVRGEADWMVDFYAEKLDKLKETDIKPSSVITGNITDKEEKYLTVQMDSNLYEYLITIDPKHFTKTKTTLLDTERENVNVIYDKKYKNKEFVLIPYDRITKRDLLENPINLEGELSLLKEDYKNLERRVNKLSSNLTEEETSSMISEIHEKWDKIERFINKCKKDKK